MFYEVSIQPAPGGFGEWQCQPINDEGWEDVNELLAEIAAQYEYFELGNLDDELPDGAEDIRGRIHNEPDRMFVMDQDGRIVYFGITRT